MRGTILLLFILSTTLCRAESFQIFEENGKVGIKNEQGKVVLPASFEALGWSDGSFSVISGVTGYRSHNQWGILNLKKEFVTKAEYENLVHARGDYFIARKKINPVQTKSGCLNLKGEIKIPFQYDGISIHGLRAIVFNLYLGHYSYGLIDLQNTVLVPLKYQKIIPMGLHFAVENERGKIAFFDSEGKVKTDFKIDSISAFQNGHAIIHKNLNQGLIDQDGVIVAEPLFQHIKIMEDQAKVLSHHEWIVLNDKNEVHRKVLADELLTAKDEGIIYRYSTKYGLLDAAMNVTLSAQYDCLFPLGSGHFIVKQKGKSGIVRLDNSFSIPIVYDSLLGKADSFRAYKKDEGWALVDLLNKPKTQKQYDWLGAKQKEIYPVKNFGYWGAVNTTGLETIHCVYDSLVEISDEQLVVKFKNQYGIISTEEKWLVLPQSLPLRLVNDSCYLQIQAQNIFLTKFSGDVIYFTDNKVEFKKDTWMEYLPDGTIKTLDYQGRLLSRVTPPPLDKLEEVYQEHEGMRGIKRDGKYGFVDSRNRLRIANRYDGIGDFHEGLAAFKLLGKWGFLDKEDHIVINPNFQSVESFKNGLCIVRKNNKAAVIDKAGTLILNFQYDSIKRQTDGKFRLFDKNLIGLANLDGSILIEPRFDFLEDLNNGYAIAGRDNKFGLIHVNGLSAIPITYDSLSFDSDNNQYLALKKAEWKEIKLNNQ
ncbi:MAG: WG repeat-containing protein [Cyclobacteriaceae bacterium]|nr:WG repeat-containing protein [Cyclobacteriaceae bacterium]